LHDHATRLAELVVECAARDIFSIAPAVHIEPIHETALVESFPNQFLTPPSAFQSPLKQVLAATSVLRHSWRQDTRVARAVNGPPELRGREKFRSCRELKPIPREERGPFLLLAQAGVQPNRQHPSINWP
jgi:hypothetical protein